MFKQLTEQQTKNLLFASAVVIILALVVIYPFTSSVGEFKRGDLQSSKVNKIIELAVSIDDTSVRPTAVAKDIGIEPLSIPPITNPVEPSPCLECSKSGVGLFNLHVW